MANFDVLPELNTPRLRLRILGPEDAAMRARFEVRNREHLRNSGPAHDEAYFTEAYWVENLAAAAARFREGSRIEFALLFPKDDGDLIGHCAFSNVMRGAFQACYLGYGLDRDAVGEGFMTEALTAALDYVFGHVRLHRVMANYMPANERSGAVLRRLGFRIEGYARDYLNIDGAWRDHILTALHSDEWAARRRSTP